MSEQLENNSNINNGDNDVVIIVVVVIIVIITDLWPCIEIIRYGIFYAMYGQQEVYKYLITLFGHFRR